MTTSNIPRLIPAAALGLLLALACGGSADGDEYTVQPDAPPSSAFPPSPAAPASPQADGKTTAAAEGPPARELAPHDAGGDESVPAWVGSLCQTPQVMETAALFREALSTPVGPLEAGLLLCDVVFSETPPKGRRWDVFGNPPDPGARLVIDENEPRPEACANDTMQAILSWPQVQIPVGAKLKLRVQDIDISRHDDAGTDLVLFEGRFPVDLSGDHYRASCRALSAGAVAAHVPPRLGLARQQLQALRGAMTPQTEASELGFPIDAERTLRRHIEDVAGYVGWTDARVGALREEQAAAWADWDRLAHAAVDTAVQAAPPEVEVAGLRWTVLAVRCLPTCEVDVRLTNPTSQGIVFRAGQHVLTAVRADGWDVPLSSNSPSPAGEEPPPIAPGASLDLTWTEGISIDDVRPARGETPVRLLRVDTTLVRLP